MGAGGQAIILLYHRVAAPATDPWELAVTPAQFDEHLEVLDRLGRVERLADIARKAEAGTLESVSFAITFDDGYADNLHAARPALEARGAPATLFVASDCIGGGPFWWDELAELLLERRGRRVYEQVWAELQPLEDSVRHERIEAIRAEVGDSPAPDGRSLTREELAEIARDGLVEVGAHTRTHPLLASLSRDRAEDEIVGSKARLEEMLERPVPAFSYPFGGPAHYGEREAGIVREAGFELACSAVPGVARSGCDRFQLPRVTVGNWDADALESRLSRLAGLVEGSTR